MDSEYATGGDRMEAVVTSLLIARWQRVHEDMIGDIAWIAIYRDDHKEFGDCRPDMQMIAPCERSGLMEEAYRQLVLHLEIPGVTTLLDAQEGRSVRQAGIAIQSKLTEHIRSTVSPVRHLSIRHEPITASAAPSAHKASSSAASPPQRQRAPTHLRRASHAALA